MPTPDAFAISFSVAETLLRSTIRHPALVPVLTDDHRTAMHLKITRNDGTPTDCLHVHNHASTERSPTAGGRLRGRLLLRHRHHRRRPPAGRPRYGHGLIETSSLVMRSKSGTIREIHSTHSLGRLGSYSVVDYGQGQ